MKNRLHCFLSHDLLPWEKYSFHALLENLKETVQLEVHEVGAGIKGAAAKVGKDSVWIVARDWRRAVKFLGVKNRANGNIFVSVLDLSSPRENIYKVLWNKVVAPFPESVKLLVHSPLNYRFFTELEGLPTSRVRFLPLPLPQFSESTKAKRNHYSVGAFGPFVSDSHLNYLVSIAHYLVQKKPDIQFHFIGTGPLSNHLKNMVGELSLSNSVKILETKEPNAISDLDLLVYSPLRNDHFLPIYYAGMAGLPVITSELPGVSDYIKDGQSGFVVQVNETKSMGELILRLSTDAVLSQSMGQKLKEILNRTVNVGSLIRDYAETFVPGTFQPGKAERAA